MLTQPHQAVPDAWAASADLPGTILSLVAATPVASPVAPAQLDEAGWEGLDTLATQHRLQPLLHHRTASRSDIPSAIAARWAERRRMSAAMALHIQNELHTTVALLGAAGLTTIALKGAWLAWHAYPEPALRPMRDLDLLLSAETAIPAFRHLLDNGYTWIEPSDLSLEDSLRLDKHLPPLLSPRGVVIELHQRLWEIDGRMDHRAPDADDEEFRRRCERQGGILFPAPTDMLAHLIIHAVYDHRLDCGGLVLSDVALLLHRRPVDWARFWAEARSRHYERGAALILSLVRDWHDGEAPIEFPADLPPIPEDILAAAGRLLFQDLETRQSAGVYATLHSAGLRRFFQRLLARRGSTMETATVSRDLAGEGGYLRWAFSRLHRTLREFGNPEVIVQARDLGRFSRWLAEGK